LPAPLSRRIAQSLDTDAAANAAFEFGYESREADMVFEAEEREFKELMLTLRKTGAGYSRYGI
jgi:hypothetical protein